jgi:glycosyltransferase involved in cell wall biosynthesis
VIPLSAVLITLNEERRLEAALKSVSFCSEIVVIDAGSTDATCQIAEAAGARVIVNAPWPGFLEQRRFAVTAARHDWILALDADERVTPTLAAEIDALRRAGLDHAGYRLPRVAFYLGVWVRATDWYPDLKLRLFDRSLCRWEGGLVHEAVKTQASVGRLRGELEHHPYADVSAHLRRIDSYTTLWAQQAHEAGRRTSSLEIASVSVATFVRNYLIKGGLRLGRVGLIVSTLNAFYSFTKLVKLQELERAAR